jgi:hypothetical protein
MMNLKGQVIIELLFRTQKKTGKPIEGYGAFAPFLFSRMIEVFSA